MWLCLEPPTPWYYVGPLWALHVVSGVVTLTHLGTEEHIHGLTHKVLTDCAVISEESPNYVSESRWAAHPLYLALRNLMRFLVIFNH